jgi:hypothetical protein
MNAIPNEGTLLRHHNIFMRCRWGDDAAKVSHIISHNNVYWMQRRACIQALGTAGDVGIVEFYNNIVLMDPDWAQQSYLGFIYLVSGGTVNEDYNCIRDYDDTSVLYLHDADSTNPNWVNKGIGSNSIEAMPLFVDPDNFDFRPRNPKVITGGRPVQGNATYMGAVPPKHNFKSNSRAGNVGGLSIIRN